MRFLPRIKQATDAVVNITTGRSVHVSLEERLTAPWLANGCLHDRRDGLQELRS
jgi:uncharacterized protein (DUF849 family)